MKVQRVCGLASKIGGFASPVVLDGLIYTSARKDVPGKPPLTMLQVMDAATGAMVYEKDMAFAAGKEMEPYPSVSQAGKYLFVSCESGETVVVEPGREYKEVARNKLGDNFRCCPVAQGDRLYIRGMKKLYCIGK
jgi:hypothetical protein